MRTIISILLFISVLIFLVPSVFSNQKSNQDVAAVAIAFIPDGSSAAAGSVAVLQNGKLQGFVHNTGRTVIRKVYVRLEVDGKTIRKGPLVNIPIGGRAVIEADFKFTSTRRYIVRLVVDYDKQIAESNERNNTVHKAFEPFATLDAEALGVAYYTQGGRYRIEDIDIRERGHIRVTVSNPNRNVLNRVKVAVLVNNRQVGEGYILKI